MSRSLWVGNLTPCPRLEHELATIFGRHGQVEEVQVRRAPTGPDCYAIVTYAQPSAAAAALHVLDRRSIPSLTQRELKLRPWDEAPSWRQQPQQQRAPQPRAFGGGWWADAEEEEEGEEEGEEEEEDDPIVELWVGNLCSRATRVALRRAFELFGELEQVTLHPAPSPRPHEDRGLQFAFVSLPASAAEAALEELNGLCVHELSGTMQLDIKQSRRSLMPLQAWRARQAAGAPQVQQQRPAAAAAKRPDGQPAAAVDEPLEALLDDGGAAPLQGPVRLISKRLVCEGPPSSVLWVGNVGGHAGREDVAAAFGSYGRVEHVKLSPAPGSMQHQFGFVEMGSAAEAARAHAALHLAEGGIAIRSRKLKVRFAWARSRVRRAAGGAAAAGSDSSGAAGAARAAAAAVATALPPEPCCAHCGAAGATAALKRCSGCRAAYFCSREHQLASWEAEHRRDCGQLAAFGKQLEQQAEQLPRDLLQLLADALRQPGGRPGRAVTALVAQAAAVRNAAPSAS